MRERHDMIKEISESWEQYKELPSVALTGASAGDILVGVCECNQGMVIRTDEDIHPCFDPLWECEHSLENVLNLHNFVVVPGVAHAKLH